MFRDTVFPTLDEAWKAINRSFLVEPSEILDYIRGSQGMVEDLIVKVKDPVCSINLHDVAFTPRSKWTHLISSYIDPEDYFDFWEKINTVTGTSYQFRFRERKGPNGPCLIALVLTREDSKHPWTRAKIIWRTAELQRKFAADLILIHHFFKDIPEGCGEKIDIQEVTLYLAQAFQSWRLVGPLVPLFCDWDEVDTEHDFGRRMKSTYDSIYNADPQPEMKFAPVIRMQAHHKRILNGEIEYSHPDDLSLSEEIERLRKRRKKG